MTSLHCDLPSLSAWFMLNAEGIQCEPPFFWILRNFRVFSVYCHFQS